ncbi:hypothetical protein HYU07_00530 [Candidatus Woesearchaeota archaeon]|nr:hypothetical protein [Candidatus Woesearchaeota archaeon]
MIEEAIKEYAIADRLITEGSEFEIQGNLIAAAGKYTAAISADPTCADAYDALLDCYGKIKEDYKIRGLPVKGIDAKINFLLRSGMNEGFYSRCGFVLSNF